MAQIIALDKLEELARTAEAEAEVEAAAAKSRKKSKLFTNLLKVHSIHKKKLHKFTEVFDADMAWIEDNRKQIRYVGEGSSRIAFALAGGLCIKLAKSAVGADQNKAEMKNCSYGMMCFADAYSVSDDNCILLTECVSPLKTDADAAKFMKAVKLDVKTSPARFLQSLADLFSKAVHASSARTDAQDLMRTMMNQYSPSDTRSSIAAALVKPDSVQRQILVELLQFGCSHKKDFDMSDLWHKGQWGFAVRNGKTAAVVLDAGYSPAVRRRWYS